MEKKEPKKACNQLSIPGSSIFEVIKSQWGVMNLIILFSLKVRQSSQRLGNYQQGSHEGKTRLTRWLGYLVACSASTYLLLCEPGKVTLCILGIFWPKGTEHPSSFREFGSKNYNPDHAHRTSKLTQGPGREEGGKWSKSREQCAGGERARQQWMRATRQLQVQIWHSCENKRSKNTHF